MIGLATTNKRFHDCFDHSIRHIEFKADDEWYLDGSIDVKYPTFLRSVFFYYYYFFYYCHVTECYVASMRDRRLANRQTIDCRRRLDPILSPTKRVWLLSIYIFFSPSWEWQLTRVVGLLNIFNIFISIEIDRWQSVILDHVSCLLLLFLYLFLFLSLSLSFVILLYVRRAWCRLYSSFPERNHKRDMSFSEVTTVASFAPGSAIHLNNLGPGSNGKNISSCSLPFDPFINNSSPCLMQRWWPCQIDRSIESSLFVNKKSNEKTQIVEKRTRERK